MNATAFQRRTLPGGAWSDASADIWQLRWENLPHDQPGGFQERQGDLAALRTTSVAAYLSPRFVAADGSCTVYIAPFSNGSTGQPKAAVLGDSLTASLNDTTYNQQHLQGYVQGNLNAAGWRVEVEGHSGRRWVASPELQGLPRAGNHLLDEARGFLQHDPQAYVIALGANDAGQMAWLPDEAARQQRLTYTLNGIRAKVNELVAAGRCVVFVTAPDNLARYWGSPPWLYAWAAQSINRELRTLANASATDNLKLQDFAALSFNHHTYSEGQENWFGDDDIHLNATGRLVYTNEITQAARQCA
ncbi:SGNH/GDSL hydrolase family protein [Actinomadura fulvescens]